MASFVTASEIELASTQDMQQHEAAYRRGFTHGVATVLDAIQQGTDIETIEAWESGRLHTWRYYAGLKFTPVPNIMETDETAT
jgi:hypothetical protein